mgnify:CR=1 FL=1
MRPAIARALHAHGAHVAIADIDRDAAARAAAALGEHVLALGFDVADRDAWASARATIEKTLGPVSILVNNAGIGPSLDPLDAADPAHFDRMIAIKLTGTFNGIHCFVPGMRARRRGHVVNTASMAGLIASARLGPYTASKFAVVGMSEVLRAELEDAGVGVSVLCPGLVSTNLGSERRDRTGAPAIAGGIDPAIVGALVIEAIRNNRAYIVTHGEYRPVVKERADRILGAFDLAPIRSATDLPGADIARS